MNLELEGKTVVVTGGASHIGRAIAFAFAEEGARVAVVDNDADQANATVAAIRAAGGDALPVIADVTDLNAVESGGREVVAALGPVDVLINNVGWNGRQEFFLGLGPERWEKSFRLNLYSAFAMTNEFLPGMVERRSGSIIFISSDAAFGDYRVSDYGAMKAGLLTFSRSIAKEYGRYGIRANAITPGMIPPDPADIGAGSFWSVDTGLGEKEKEDLDNRTPLRRRTEAMDVAWTTLFLTSARARQLTGQLISVSGGFQMPR
jgi:2-hydroxycyclohexanecarboxyl-CoA dehydrogenase